jgi:hypothetical protein
MTMALRFSIPLLALGALGCATQDPSAEPTRPYGGKGAAIPGLVEAEHYDEGPAGVAYHDVTPKNEGANYRGETQVDIEARPDATNGHGIGWTRAGEWLVYTVDVKEAGTYSIDIPVASNKKGGTFHLEFGGVDRTGPIAVPDTGSWQKLVVIKKEGVRLAAGRQVMKMVMDAVGDSRSIGDIDHLKFTRTGP